MNGVDVSEAVSVAHQARVEPMDRYNNQLVQNVHPTEWKNPTPNGRYNLVVIGAGTAGLVTAAIAAGSTHFVKSAPGDAARFCGVSMVPGMTQLTLMFEVLSSFARDSVRRSTADFDAP